MRKFFLLLAVALLISIPAFAIGNQQVAVSPTVVAAGPMEVAQTEPVPTDATQVADEEAVKEEVVEEADVEESTAETPEVKEPTPFATTPVATPVAQAVPAVPVTVVTQKVQEPEQAPKAVAETPVPVAAEPVTPAQEAPVVVEPPVPLAVTVDMPLIDTSSTGQGIITINYSGTVKARLEVRKGDVKYYYNIYPRQDSFPLQMGSGQYTITVFENTTDNKYRAVERSIVDVTIASANTVFLASVQEIAWSEQSLAAAKARQLAATLGTDREKFEAVYHFIVANIDYDTPKLATLTSTYLPSIDQTLTSGKGICYDHASLTAAMLRSLGIPAKLVKGYASTVQGYHAWNEVYIDGQWLIMDASVDAQRRARGAEITMIKSTDVYRKTQEF
ncbi:MAG TPA: transglutaminase domain-containing protein [Bacillota bacterium]|nr:transglutaminase domain-containing protein [Bacillota bacterium]